VKDLSHWSKCYCGGWIWKQHTPSIGSHHTFSVYQCKICIYSWDIAWYRRQYHLDLHNKISDGTKMVRDTGEHSAHRVTRTTVWLFKTLDTPKALEIFEEVFTEHIDKITRLWVRNLRLELSNR
jgi:hypothetical protein